ncbi:MAG: glycosyltransferase, partial [bacterium]
MNIVFVNSCPYMGGAEMWHLRTALAFCERGHDVHMLVRPGPLAERARGAGLPVMKLPMRFDLDLYSFFRALLYFRRVRPDVVLLNDQRECRLIAPAAAAAGVKVRVQRKGWPFLKGSWRDRLTYKFFVPHVIANSHEIARLFRNKSGLAPERIVFFPNGFDLGRFRPVRDAAEKEKLRHRWGAGPESTVIGTAARLVEQKGLHVLIEAMPHILEKGIDAQLFIAGEGKLKSSLERLARQKGVWDRVVFQGPVEDMPSFLGALDVFVLASTSEGRSNALAEALAMGLPVVATDIPGNVELVEHEKNGLLVSPEDPVSVASAVERFVNDTALRERLAANARRYAEDNL